MKQQQAPGNDNNLSLTGTCFLLLITSDLSSVNQ